MPKAIRAFKDTFSTVAVSLREGNSYSLCRAVLEGEVDVAFIRPPPPDPEHIALVALFDEAMLVALPKGHPLERARSIAIADLSPHAFVLHPRRIGPTQYDAIIAACREAGFTPKQVQEAPQVSSAINLVAAGLGISIVPASMQQIHTQGVTYRSLRGNQPRAPLSLASRRGDTAAAVRNFIKLVQATARQQRHA